MVGIAPPQPNINDLQGPAYVGPFYVNNKSANSVLLRAKLTLPALNLITCDLFPQI